MDIIRFILSNWDSVLLVIICIMGVIFMYKKGETQKLKEILFKLVVEAERTYGSGTGELKRAAVFELAYDKMPALLKRFISQKELESMIEEALAYAKIKWETNKKLLGYVDGKPPPGMVR